MNDFSLISLGAILGANMRYWLGDWAARRWGTAFPFGTVLINLTGSFILGFIVSAFVDRLGIDPRWRAMLVIGFLGSYTTFSTYTLESVNLASNGQWALGALNLLGSALAGGLAAFLGLWLGRSLH